MQVRSHQLRHSCATLLLNAGAPILTVQTILGHPCLPKGKCRHSDTTLGYTGLYDGTVAADYCRATDQAEQRLALAETAGNPIPDRGQLLALVDSLGDGTLNEVQKEALQLLRQNILTWGEEVSGTPDKAGSICQSTLTLWEAEGSGFTQIEPRKTAPLALRRSRVMVYVGLAAALP